MQVVNRGSDSEIQRNGKHGYINGSGAISSPVSRESSHARSQKKKQKVITIDGARVIQNGNVYRQLFDAEVQLNEAMKTMKHKRANKPPDIVHKSTRSTNLPVVNNMITVRGMLNERGLLWTSALPNESRVENPVLYKQHQEIFSTEKLVAETDLVTREVIDLPDLVKPAKDDSNILDRIIEKRKGKHNHLIEEMHQELSQINKDMEPHLSEVSDHLIGMLGDSDKHIENVIQPLCTDSTLVSLSHADLNLIWQQISKQSKLRQDWILKFDSQLSDLEDDRVLRIRNVISRYCELLERSSHMAPPDLHRIIDNEVMELNHNLLANRRAFSDLTTRLLMADIEREHRQHQFWGCKKDDWKTLNTSEGLQDFKNFMSSEEVIDPPVVKSLIEELHAAQARIADERNRMILELRESLKPPGFTKITVHEWNQRIVDISKEIDKINQSYLQRIHNEYENIIQICLKKMEKLKKEMIDSGVCDEEEAQSLLKEDCIPMIGNQQTTFEETVQKMDKSFEAATNYLSRSLKSLFKFCQGLAQLWDRHELGLAGQERKLSEKLEASRAGHEANNLEKEAALDMLMDKMRQEATETGLKESLRKALELLDKIKQGYLQFHNQQLHIVKGYPGMVVAEVDIFNEVICKYFGLKKAEAVSNGDSEKSKSSSPTKSSSPSKKVNSEDAEEGEKKTSHKKKGAAHHPPEPKSQPQTLKSVLTSTCGTEYLILAVAGEHGPPVEGVDSEGVIPPEGSNDDISEKLSGLWVDNVLFEADFLMNIKKCVREHFLDFLDDWAIQSMENARAVVATRSEEMENEYQLRLHLHEPRPRRAELDIHNVRAAELVLHSERVMRHCKGIAQTLSDLRLHFSSLDEEQNELQEKFRVDIEALNEVFNTATKSSKIANMGNQLNVEVNKFMEVIRTSLRQYRQKVDDKLQTVREANARFIMSFKLFSEGGNFCPEEVDDYRKRLEKMGLKIDESESSILSELEGIEKKRQDYVMTYVRAFEERFKHQLVDLVFNEKIARWLTNTQVKIKAEVANCNSQAQKLADYIQDLERRIDACENPTLDKEEVNPNVLNASMLKIFQACQDRSIYLNAIKTQIQTSKPPSMDGGGGGATAAASAPAGLHVMFVEPTPVTKTGRQVTDDPSITLIHDIFKTQRSRTNDIRAAAEVNEESGNQEELKSGEIKNSGTNQTASIVAGSQHGSNERSKTADESKSRKGSVALSNGDAVKEPNVKESKKKRHNSAGRAQFVSKNQRLDKKYQTFGEATDENEATHFNGRVRAICRESLEGILFIAEIYYRAKGVRAVTRPQSLQETFDQCADVVTQKLNSYAKQAADYHNSCLKEFCDHLIEIEELAAHIPALLMSSVMKEIIDDVRNQMREIDEIVREKMSQLDQEKEFHKSELRPSTGHPNRQSELEALCQAEDQRHSAMLDLSRQHKENLRCSIATGGCAFAERIGELSEVLLLQWDNLLTVDEVEGAVFDPVKYSTATLLRQQYMGELVEEEQPRTTLIERGKHTWPGGNMAEFVNLQIREARQSSSKQTSDMSDLDPTAGKKASSAPKGSTNRTTKSGATSEKKADPSKSAPSKTTSVASSSKKQAGSSADKKGKTAVSKQPNLPTLDQQHTFSVVTAKTTMAHNETLAARNKVIEKFRHEFQEMISQVDKKIYKQDILEERWYDNWQKSVSTIKNLY